MKAKRARTSMSPEELRLFNEKIKGSGRVYRNRKKYYRATDKKVA